MYSGRASDGRDYTFGSSGLLYRSNKLMFDRKTYSLWSNLTGEPVVGVLSKTSAKLTILPMTLTTWEEWKQKHPDTTVVYLDPEFGNRWGYRYTPGAADRARAGVRFPIWLKNSALKDKTEVYALRMGGDSKAYPIDLVLEQKVIHDQIGETKLVMIADPQSGAIRVFQRKEQKFVISNNANSIQDESGRIWKITEENLVLENSSLSEKLPRVPGHVSLWFAWYGFFPQTEIYSVP